MDLNTLREYIKIQIISLEQDLEMTTEPESYRFYEGGIEALEDILGVING